MKKYAIIIAPVPPMAFTLSNVYIQWKTRTVLLVLIVMYLLYLYETEILMISSLYAIFK